MKPLKGILFFVGLVIIFLFAGLVIYFQKNGKGLLEEALQVALKRNVHISGGVFYQPPLGVKATKIDIENLMHVPSVTVQFNPEVFLSPSHLKIASVVFSKPLAVVERFDKMEINQPEEQAAAPVIETALQVSDTALVLSEVKLPEGEKVAVVSAHRKRILSVNIDRFVVKDGQLYFTQHSADREISFKVEDIRLEARDIIFPSESAQTKFDFEGKLVKQNLPFSGNKLKGHGWFNMAARDMEGQLKVTGEDESVGLSADVISQNNDMTVKGNVNLNNLLKAENISPPSTNPSALDSFSSAISSMGFQIGGTFMFKTKMDDFQLSNISFSGNVIKLEEPGSPVPSP